MTDPLPIQPFGQALDQTLSLPGSKSITNRALILAALAQGKTRLEGALFSRDTRIMLAALDQLGFEITVDEPAASIDVTGRGGTLPNNKASINVGNAGTAARFLTAFLALNAKGTYHLDGDPPMRERPMAGLLDALGELGAAEFEFHGQPGHFPFTLKAEGYRAGEASVDARASSQILSALLLAAPANLEKSLSKPSERAASTGAAIKLLCNDVRPHYIAITLKMRESFGAAPVRPEPVEMVEPSKSGEYILPPTRYKAPASGVYAIEPDISAASYFLALTLIHGGSLRIPNLSADPLQGDAYFVEVLAHHGLRVDADRKG